MSKTIDKEYLKNQFLNYNNDIITPKIKAEAERAKSVENKLNDAITTETTRATNAESTLTSSLSSHTSNKSNPHGVTAAQVGLSKAIISGSQTTTSSADGGDNIYTFTDVSGNTSTITVKNGSKGSKGDTGSQGAKGDTGATGSQGAKGDTGATGTGIKSVIQTTTSTADGGTNICTITLTDGTTSTFSFKNGSKGATGATGTNATTTAVATTSSNGLMSASDKTTLNAVSSTYSPLAGDNLIT